MRLYLSSFLFGNDPEWLKTFCGSRRQVALILNALDHNEASRVAFLQSQSKTLETLGFSVVEIDLREFFGKPEQLADALRAVEVLWVNGGNTFILRRAMRQSGFDVVALPLIQNGLLLYGGFSAGCAVLHPDLHGIELSDDPVLVPEFYQRETIWEGLGLLKFHLAVHYNSDHPESHSTDREIEFYKSTGRSFKPLRDGEVILVDGVKVTQLS